MHTPTADLWHLPHRLQSLVEAELNDGEEIIWIGTPIPRRFGMRALPLVLFGIPWTAFALFWIAGAAGFAIPDFKKGFDLFPLFGIPFVLIGIGMLCSPLWMMQKAKKTAYVLTSDRAVIIAGSLSTNIRSFGPDRLTDLRRKQHSDGSGDLIFEREAPDTNSGSGKSIDHGFLAISDVKDVENLVRQMVETSAHKESQSN